MLLLLAAFMPFLLIGFLIWYGVFRAGATIADLLSPFLKTTSAA